MYVTYLVFCILGAVIVFKVVRIQFTSKENMARQTEALRTQMRTIEASRGNIYSDNNSLLATSIPYYEIRMDLYADGLTNENFTKNVDSLSLCLANLFRDRTVDAYKARLVEARADTNRYLLIQRKVKHDQLLKLKKFPLYNLGKNKSGLIIIKENKRSRPYGYLAARTIGYERVDRDRPTDTTRAGLEGAYSKFLNGINGQQLMKKVGPRWKPVSENYSVMPQNGCDIISTLDIHLQAVAEEALHNQLIAHQAKSGCVVVMEVETGYVKAIANLTLDEEGEYYESFNHAIGTSMEPGSTMKLASTIVALEQNAVKPEDIVHTGTGVWKPYADDDFEIKDTHGNGDITFEQAFVVSSNIGISRPIWDNYRGKPSQFIEGLKKLGVHLPVGIDLKGEANPYVKKPGDRTWSGTTLPQMSIGYEIRSTPLQTLTLYNAVANNGKMVKPQFVKEIRRGITTIKQFEPVVLNEKICSDKTLKQVRKMMELVVERGTGKELKSANFKIAGKTGTAQILEHGRYSKEKYLASFCGYFPANRPKYSCIVVIRETKSGQYYGAEISAPVFKEIADKIYSRKIELHNYLNTPFQKMTEAPELKNTRYSDAQMLLKEMKLKSLSDDDGATWVRTGKKGRKVTLTTLATHENIVPDVIGMGLKDAMALLEEQGLKVIVHGTGTVKRQSLPAGNRVYKGQKIIIELRLS
ncbi:MAG TPA: penicillin-binding transpeptidase domain-containing protein [Flavobacteriales bacterium]|nr:penicillin-binding transpeptidase domain-containing protein [Flavobacteriales bacterium]